jgi:hypothetical protein
MLAAAIASATGRTEAGWQRIAARPAFGLNGGPVNYR